jgi:putative hydrolase of the HAD superfamily
VPTKFRGIEAVLFDAVGTLIHPDPPAAEVYQRAGAELGAELSLEEVDRRFRTAFAVAFADSHSATSDAIEKAKWREVVAAVFRDTPAPLDRLFAELWDHFALSKHWSVYSDVAPMWRELEARGLQLGVASNYDDRLPGALAGLPPLDRCERVYWSSRVGYAKPHAEYFHFIARLLNLPLDKILMVGDDPEKDIAGARAAGFSALLLDRQSRAPSSQSMSTLAALPSLLE